MYLVYVEDFPVEALTPAFPRPASFYKSRPEFLEMQKIIIDSLLADGLKYPLCAINKLDNGIVYHVGMGMQRLAALKKLDWATCKAVIACRPTDSYIPLGLPIKNRKELEDVFGTSLRKFHLAPNSFEAQPAEDPKQWDPIRLRNEGNK